MAEPVVLPDRGRSWAVLIGACQFTCLPELPAVHNNLRDLRSALTDPRFGVLDRDHCEIIDDPESPAVFMSRLRRAADRTDDLLLVYYAGHGLRHGRRDSLCLTLPASDPESLDGSSVPFEWVKDVLEDSHARTNLLLLDCCYSGMALGVMSAGLDRHDIEVRGTAVIASSPKNSLSHAPLGDQYTAFTGKMITLLRDGSPVLDEPLTVGALFKRLSAALVNEEFPRPLSKTTDTSGDLLVRQPPPPPRLPAVVDLPPTVPAVELGAEPVAGPVVEPAPVVPGPPVTDADPRVASPAKPAAVPKPAAGRSSTRLRFQLRLRTLQTLCTLTAVFLALAVSALAGVMSGEKATDELGSQASAMGTFLVLAGVTGVPFVVLRYRWTDLRRPKPTPLLSRSLIGRLVLSVCLLVLFGTMIGVLATGWGAGETSNTVLAIALTGEGAGFCAYELYRWRRSREVRR